MNFETNADIQKFVAKLKPGDTLNILPGIYREKIDFYCKGTLSAPIRINFEPGARVRGTIPISPAKGTPNYPNVYVTPWTGGAPYRMVQLLDYNPIPVIDPNGVKFDLVLPPLFKKKPTIEEVNEVSGSFYHSGTELYFRPFTTPTGIEAGFQYDGNVRFSGEHVIVTGLNTEYGLYIQFYGARNCELINTNMVAMPLMMMNSLECKVSNLLEQNYIQRGDTNEWHSKGSGTAFVIDDNCTDTKISNVTIMKNWNGAALGGIDTTVDLFKCFDNPNHAIGISAIGGTYSRLATWNTQDSLWVTTALNCTIKNSLIRGSYLAKACKNVVFRNNAIMGKGHVVLPDSIEGFDSDYNYFNMAGRWDYRVNDVRANSLLEAQHKFSLELNSIQVTDAVMSAGLNEAIYLTSGR